MRPERSAGQHALGNRVTPVTVATNLSNEVDTGDTAAREARTGKHLLRCNVLVNQLGKFPQRNGLTI